MRAECATVERANAKARQHDIEKEVAERATLGPREQMQRSVTEKYISERDVITRQSSFSTGMKNNKFSTTHLTQNLLGGSSISGVELLFCNIWMCIHTLKFPWATLLLLI